MSYHQNKSCVYCGWAMREVVWRPLAEEYSCEECNMKAQHAALMGAVGGGMVRGLIDEDPDAAEHMTHTPPPQLSLTFDDLYERQERQRALQARVEGWAF